MKCNKVVLKADNEEIIEEILKCEESRVHITKDGMLILEGNEISHHNGDSYDEREVEIIIPYWLRTFLKKIQRDARLAGNKEVIDQIKDPVHSIVSVCKSKLSLLNE